MLGSLERMLKQSKQAGVQLFLLSEITKEKEKVSKSSLGLDGHLQLLQAEIAELQSFAAGQPEAVSFVLQEQIKHKQDMQNAVRKEMEQLRTQQEENTTAKVEGGNKTQSQVPKAESAKIPPEFECASFTPIAKYAWDQGKSLVTIYLTMDGLSDQNQVHCNFTQKAIDLRIINCNGKNYRLAIPNLCYAIQPSNCTLQVKLNNLKVKMKKGDAKDWEGLDDTERKKKEQHAQLASSGATTEDLLRNMYNQADDATRESLAKAAMEGQKKRDEAAKKGGTL